MAQLLFSEIRGDDRGEGRWGRWSVPVGRGPVDAGTRHDDGTEHRHVGITRWYSLTQEAPDNALECKIINVWMGYSTCPSPCQPVCSLVGRSVRYQGSIGLHGSRDTLPNSGSEIISIYRYILYQNRIVNMMVLWRLRMRSDSINGGTRLSVRIFRVYRIGGVASGLQWAEI